MYDVLLNDVPLEDCIEGSSVRNLFVAPASLDLAGAEIELVPAFSRELRLKRAIGEVLDDYDYVLIDCPPSLGLLTVNAMAAATEVLVPIQCEYYALEGLGQLLRNVDLVQKNLNPAARGQRHRPGDVRRPDQAGRPGGDRGARPLRRHGLSQRRAPNGPAVGGAVVRPADHHIRSKLSRGHRLPRAGQGGKRWHGAAVWVKDSGRSSPPPRWRTSPPPSCRTSRSAQIEPNRHQPRAYFDEEALVSLTASVAAVGVLQPVLVRPDDNGRFQLIAGERRWRAAKRAGLQTIPALVRTVADADCPRAGPGREPPP